MDVLRLTKVGKQLQRHGIDRPRRLREIVSRAGGHNVASQCFWAVRDISLSVRPGEMLGIIGGNGAGKSTLLRLCGGVVYPTEGVVQRRGRAEAFFDYTAGLQPDLVCQDNVILGLAISGYGLREAKSAVHEVLEFADLLEHRHSPVRVLSTGMRLRLGYAIATQQRPDLLLLDEVVSVGDAEFQERSSLRTSAFLKAGTAAVLVSHDMQLVQSLCERAIWLHHGQSASYGSADVVTNAYIEADYNVDDSNGGTGITDDEPLRMRLETFVNGNPDTAPVTSGDPIELGFEINVDQALGEVRPAIALLDDNGQLQTYLYYQSTIEHSGGRLAFSVTLEKMGLADGIYQVAVYIHSADWSTTLGEFVNAASIEIQNAPEGAGALRPQSKWRTSVST